MANKNPATAESNTKEPRIECIAVPLTPREIPDLSPLLATWAIYHQNESDECEDIDLLITLPCSQDSQLKHKIEQRCAAFKIHSMFRNVRIEFLSIPPEEDVYIRYGQSYNGRKLRFGHKSGPNLQFFRTMNLAFGYSHTLLNEVDMLPTNSRWIASLNNHIRLRINSFVVGARYRGSSKIGPDIAEHINGNAIYATGNPDFQSFLQNEWVQGVEIMCDQLPDTAYDIWITRRIHQLNDHSVWGELTADELNQLYSFKEKFSSIPSIMNLSLPSDCIKYNDIDDLASKGVDLIHGKDFILPILCRAIDKQGSPYPSVLAHRLLADTCLNSSLFRLFLEKNVFKSVDKAQRISCILAEKSNRAEKRLTESSNQPVHTESKVGPEEETRGGYRYFAKLSDVAVYTRSYAGDRKLLPFLYDSIQKHVADAAEVILVIETKDVEAMTPFIPDWVKLVQEETFTAGTIQHKYSKLTADTHTDKDFIFHIDSDSVVTERITPDHLAKNGKPYLEITQYNSLLQHQNSEAFIESLKHDVLVNHLPQVLSGIGVKDQEQWKKEHFEAWFIEWFEGWRNSFGLDMWKEGTEFALGLPVHYEFSQKPEKLYPREIYSLARQRIEKVHDMSFKDFICTRIGRQAYGANRKDYFSDLNFIGACLYSFMPQQIEWLKTEEVGYDFRLTKIRQLISYDILDAEGNVKESAAEMLRCI